MLLLLLACIEPTGTGFAADPADSGTPDTGDTAELPATLYDDDAIAVIEKAVRSDLRGSNASGVQIAVWYDGQLVYTLESGTRHPDTDETIAADTLFQIGSDTKKMTALAALQQVEAGTLALDSTVASVLPKVVLAASPDWAKAATLHDLLSHQGGLFDYTPWNDDPADSQLRAVAEGLFAENEWAMNEPGAFWNYSNPNFSIAGLMTEAAAGSMWPDVLHDDVFVPLGLSNTFARKSEVEDRGNYATGWGYTLVDADPWNVFDSPRYTEGTVEMDVVMDNAFTRPAGMVWSTASDMARFHAFFIDGDSAVLSHALRTEMTTMQTRLYPAWDAQGYGYGWTVVEGVSLPDYYDIPMWVHGGNTLSFTSASYVLPEQRLSVSILSNGYGDDFTRTVVALLAESGVLPESTRNPGAPTAETDAERLEGTYLEPILGRIVVGWDGSDLTVEMPDADEAGVSHGASLAFAGLTDVYTLTVAGSSQAFVFTPAESGEYRWMASRGFVGTRTP